MSNELPLPPRRGRRDNGLDAAMYVPLTDVDPRIGEHLLDVLKFAGVPAYLEPSADVEPYTRALALPSPPTDRLWVDREQRTTAREIVEAEVGTPEPRAPGEDRPSRGLTDAEEEQAWRQIVADFAEAPDTEVPPWPVVEDASLTDDEDEDDRDEDDRDGDGGTSPGGRSGRAGGADDTGIQGEPDEDHFVPPPPPPMPRLSRHSLAAVLLLAAGGMLLVAPSALGFGDTTGFALGVAAIVCSAGLLVWRLGDRRSDDGPDDGAIV